MKLLNILNYSLVYQKSKPAFCTTTVGDVGDIALHVDVRCGGHRSRLLLPLNYIDITPTNITYVGSKKIDFEQVYSIRQ